MFFLKFFFLTWCFEQVQLILTIQKRKKIKNPLVQFRQRRLRCPWCHRKLVSRENTKVYILLYFYFVVYFYTYFYSSCISWRLCLNKYYFVTNHKVNLYIEIAELNVWELKTKHIILTYYNSVGNKSRLKVF